MLQLIQARFCQTRAPRRPAAELQRVMGAKEIVVKCPVNNRQGRCWSARGSGHTNVVALLGQPRTVGACRTRGSHALMNEPQP